MGGGREKELDWLGKECVWEQGGRMEEEEEEDRKKQRGRRETGMRREGGEGGLAVLALGKILPSYGYFVRSVLYFFPLIWLNPYFYLCNLL